MADDISDIVGFVKRLSDSDAVKVVGFASGVYGYTKTLVGLFSDDSAKIVGERLDKIQNLINQGFVDIGSLINNQIERVIQNQQTLAMQQAQAQSIGAVRSLFEFKESGQHSDLSEAGALSSVAVEFFKQQTDPFFLPGMSTAGSVRIDFHRAADSNFANDPTRKSEIAQQISVIENMISVVRLAVNSYHTVEKEQFGMVEHLTGKGPIEHPQPGFAHRDSRNPWPLRSYIYKLHPQDFVDPDENRTLAQAKSLAQKARDASVKAELNFLSIPKYESTVLLWRSLAGLQTQDTVVKHVLQRAATAQDVIRGSRPLFQVEATPPTPDVARLENFHEAPSTIPSIIPDLSPDLFLHNMDGPAKNTSVEDVRYFLLDLLTGQEFQERFVTQHLDDSSKVSILAIRRLFGRRIEEDEKRLCSEIVERLGFEALAAALVFSREYQDRYRGGFPCCGDDVDD